MESPKLKESGKEKVRGEFHPKCKSERRKVTSMLSWHFFPFSMGIFVLCLFFFYFTSEEDKKGKLLPFFASFFSFFLEDEDTIHFFSFFSFLFEVKKVTT